MNANATAWVPSQTPTDRGDGMPPTAITMGGNSGDVAYATNISATTAQCPVTFCGVASILQTDVNAEPSTEPVVGIKTIALHCTDESDYHSRNGAWDAEIPSNGASFRPQNGASVTPPPAPNGAQATPTVTPESATGAMTDSVSRGAPKKGKSKNAELVDDSDPREHLNVVFIGHVDAGKSTLAGSILYQTGMVDKRIIDKFEREAKERNRESWFLAFIMDTNEEERAKGKTVEVGRACFETTDKRYTILDAPGHKNYVPNMIQGASQADIGILVISARRGEFEAGFDGLGQTREHAMLAKTLGINKLIIVINKMDEKTVKWDKGRYDQIQKKMKPFLRTTCGFRLKRDVSWIPISALTGANLKDRAPEEVCSWYRGPSLLEHLNTTTIKGRDPNGPLRIPVLDKTFDRGVVALGKVESGTLWKGMKLTVMPMNIITSVLSITIDIAEEQTREVNAAKPGENVRIKLKGLAERDVHKGFVLCDTDHPTHAVRRFEAQINILQLLKHRCIITAGYNCIFHCHTISEECCFEKLTGQMNLKTGKKMKRKPMFVKSNNVVTAQLSVKQSISVETFKHVAQLGRFTLRDEGRTIGIGKITKLLRENKGAIKAKGSK